MNIGIDIDDTIAISTEKWIETALKYEEKHPSIIKIKNKKFYNLTSHRWLEEFFLWEKEVKEKFFTEYSNKVLKSLEAKENASKVINKLYEEGNNIFIVTARHPIGENSDIYNITKEWLVKNNIKYSKIFFNAGNIKLDICKKEQIDIFIDDSYSICKELNKNNIPVLLMKNKYNNIDDFKITKVENWNEIYNRIVNKS